jgi:tetratricopeptide (TPR) repeat protein
MWRQVVAQSPGKDAADGEILRYDIGWRALNTLLRAGRSLSGHERNCCFLNTKAGRFADISAAARLDFDDDGRVLAVCDWDQDGDEDFWIANRTGPQVRFLRNDKSNRHGFVAFRLTGTTCNRDAIGARVEVHLGDGNENPLRVRTLRAGEGYLAQCGEWLHFGLGDAQKIDNVVVRWPDGSPETFDGIAPNRRYQITQGTGKAEPWQPPRRSVKLKPSNISVPPSAEQTRVVLIAPVPIPSIRFESLGGELTSVAAASGRARIVNLWATWCQPCVAELEEWRKHAVALSEAGLDVVLVNVDGPEADRSRQQQAIADLSGKLRLPFTMGFGTSDLVVQFDVLQRSIIRRQRPLPVPSSFMIDARGNLRIIYKGPVAADQLIADAKLLDAPPEEVVASSVPYAGKWLGQPAGTAPNSIAIRFVEGGFQRETEQYILQLEKHPDVNPMYNRADANALLAAIYVDQNRLTEAADAFRRALQFDPNHRQAHIELARVLARLKDFAGAAEHYRHALEPRPNDPELRLNLGMALYQAGDAESAISELKHANLLRPSAVAYHHAGNAYIRLGRPREAIEQFRAAVQLDPRFGPALNNLAWLLATSNDDSLRDGAAAVDFAERLCDQPPQRTTGNLDTLAAAYAEARRFEDAVITIKEAIRQAHAAGELEKSPRMEKRLEQYEQHMPYRE